MIENERFQEAHQHVNDAHAIVVGLLAVLDGMAEELAYDSRGHVLVASLESVRNHLVEASDGLDMYAMESASDLGKR